MIPRCAVAAQARGESLIGTASTVTRFLLLEDPGPWGVDALRDARMPVEVKEQLMARARRSRVRVVLIRRHGRSRPGPLRCFAVCASVDNRWVEATLLDDIHDVLNLDLAALGEARSLGLDRHKESLFLVCTHGRHDACCAERGRPLASALSLTHPTLTWECSHIGGDRFAGNLVILPDGLYYGRVDEESGPRIAAGHLRGQLDLGHLRGRVTQSFPAQAAEWLLRTELGVTGLDDVRLVSDGTRGERPEAVFAVADSARWRVRVRIGKTEPEPLSCRAKHLSLAPTYKLLDITRDNG